MYIDIDIRICAYTYIYACSFSCTVGKDPPATAAPPAKVKEGHAAKQAAAKAAGRVEAEARAVAAPVKAKPNPERRERVEDDKALDKMMRGGRRAGEEPGIHICVCVSLCIFIDRDRYRYMHTYIHIYIYICMYVYI